VPSDRLKDLEERTRYLPGDVEPRVFERWESAGIFHPHAQQAADQSFSIAVPPPNVTGVLHMGHALNGSIQDVLIRLARMRGKRTKWIFGTDHAGIATQVKVEQALAEQGRSKEDVGREEFIERVWEWRKDHGSQITEQFKRLGASLDYGDERFTMDSAYAEAVVEVFVALYEKGLIYRDNYMVNWDPGTRSAISDLEVEQREMQDTLYMVDYPLASGSGSITVATVRPETMLADTAIAVNPADERYTRLIGEEAILPLVGRRLRIIGDEYVKTDFGTGALKITPGHDPNDFEIGRKHGLEEISVIGEDGRMTEAAGERFAGLTADDAQRAVVKALREGGLLSGTQPYVHDVPHSHRSGQRIEPLISLQWFCDMEKLAGPAIAAVKSGELRFHPENPWTGVYLDWLENIRPWCVSRQLWWGHQLPVWYREGETHVGAEPPDGEGWERDPDVLDTWFSSALWPFATLGWPRQTPELRAFYPTDVLSTARDIIFLWVARMVMFGVEFTGELPFRDVPIHSVIQAPDGRRMSKSLGTGIDPLDLIDGGPRPPVYKEGGDFPAYGADALRFGLLASSSSQDVRFNEERVRQGRDLANKLWNASRLILLGVQEGVAPSPDQASGAKRVVPAHEDLPPEDRWILSRLERITARTTESLDAFELSAAALDLYDFFWSELCDWYLELAKPRLYDELVDRTAVSATLLHCLDRTLRLLHPLMPHVTEEIWSFLPAADGAEGGLLAVAEWPAPDAARIDAQAEELVGRCIAAVTELRRYRDEAGVKPSAVLPARFAADGYDGTAAQVARLARLELSDGDGDAAAEVPVPGGAVQLLASDDFDPGAIAARLAERRDKLADEVGRLEAKLANERFVQRAPAEVVQGERDKLADYRAELERLV
jgi:valyl-tRNA synthetase